MKHSAALAIACLVASVALFGGGCGGGGGGGGNSGPNRSIQGTWRAATISAGGASVACPGFALIGGDTLRCTAMDAVSFNGDTKKVNVFTWANPSATYHYTLDQTATVATWYRGGTFFTPIIATVSADGKTLSITGPLSNNLVESDTFVRAPANQQ